MHNVKLQVRLLVAVALCMLELILSLVQSFYLMVNAGLSKRRGKLSIP